MTHKHHSAGGCNDRVWNLGRIGMGKSLDYDKSPLNNGNEYARDIQTHSYARNIRLLVGPKMWKGLEAQMLQRYFCNILPGV